MSIKPAIKTLWLIIAAAFLIGCGLAGLGFALGASRAVYFDERGLHAAGATSESSTERISNKDTEVFTDVKIEVYSTNIEFVVSDNNTYGYEIFAPDIQNRKFSYQLENGSLSIKQREQFHIGFFDWGSDYQGKVSIFVPKDWEFGTIEISSASGDILMPNSSINGRTLRLRIASGDVKILSDLNCSDELNAEMASGEIMLSKITAPKIDISVASGGVSATEINSDDVHIKSASGSIAVGLLSSISELKLRLETLSGDARMTIAGAREDFNREVNVLSGDVIFDGTIVGNNYKENGTTNASIKIDAASGDIKIDFVSNRN